MITAYGENPGIGYNIFRVTILSSSPRPRRWGRVRQYAILLIAVLPARVEEPHMPDSAIHREVLIG